jgi:hypothetical protein
MSTSENESGKAELKSGKIINGWWRIWIVFSTIWVSLVLFKSITEWFEYGLNAEISPSQYSIYEEIDSQNKSLIFESQEQAKGSKFKEAEIINHGSIILFKSNATEEQMREFVKSYCNIGRSLQFKKRRDYILFGSGLIFIPPMILLISGKTIAWIISGFKSHR